MELYRNLALAGACVFFVTLVLIANIWTSIIVFTCVIFTLVSFPCHQDSLSLPPPLSFRCTLFLLPFYLQSLCLYIQVDVAGTMYFWGVTIDTASSILLTLCVGLAVDYSAHIGHTFMTVSGSKNGEIFLIGYRTSIAQTILCQTFWKVSLKWM